MKHLFGSSLRLVAVALILLISLAGQAQINPTQVISIGRNALYFEDYVLAIQYFNQVIRARPTMAEPYFYRAVAKISLDDYQGAEQDASLAIERNPFIVDAYQVRGVARQNQGKFQEAISDYERGLELMPEDKVMLTNWAVCHTALKHYDQAAKGYERLLRLDPKNDRGYLGMAHNYLQQGDTTAALEAINHSISLSRNNAGAYAMRSEIATRYNHDFQAAVADMDSAILLEPHEAGYFINRAYMRYNLDDYFGAMSDYDYAIKLQPTSLEAHYNRALLRAEVGDYNHAIDDLDFVLKGDPSNFMALYNRAMLYLRIGQYNKAVADYTAILKKYPNFEAGYMARGEAKRRMGDMRGGNADYDHAMAIFRRNKTHVSTFNPAEIEATAAIKKAEQRAATGEQEPETAEEIINRYNTLVTIPADNPVKPEYANHQRGHVQNANVEIEPIAPFMLSYYAPDNLLQQGGSYYMREIDDANDAHLLPARLVLAIGDARLSEQQISERFASIEYYNSLLAQAQPRAIDYFARGLDQLQVKNPAAAIADASLAASLSPNMALAYFLRANARYMQYRLSRSAEVATPTTAADAKVESMLHQREDQATLAATVADLDTVISLSPKNVYAYFDKAVLLTLQGNITGAISCYSQALDIKPDLGEAYYNRGLMYLRMGNKALGVADLSKAGELGILPSYNVLKRMNR